MPRQATGTKGGLQTPAGKAITARNALSHGLTSVRPVIPGLESEVDWESHRAGVLDSLRPEGHLETALADRIATLLWRLQRVVRFESASVAMGQSVYETLPQGQFTTEDSKVAGEWRTKGFMEPIPSISWAGLASLILQLPTISANTEINRNAVSALLLTAAQHAAGGNDSRKILAEAIPQGMGLGENWPADKLRDAIARIATRTGITPEMLLRSVRSEAETKAEQKRQAFLTNRSQTCILPDSSKLDKIMRYEAHLNRLLLSAFHELEALQERRLGHSAPLARIDVTNDVQP